MEAIPTRQNIKNSGPKTGTPIRINKKDPPQIADKSNKREKLEGSIAMCS